MKKLQKQAIERYAEICRRYGNSLAGSDEFVRVFLTVMEKKLSVLRSDTVTSVPGVLKIMSLWAEDYEFFKYFKTYPQILPILVSLYNREKINVSIIAIVHKIFSNLLGITETTSKQDELEIEEYLEEEEEEDEQVAADNVVEEEEQRMEVEEEEPSVKKTVIRTMKVVNKSEEEKREEFASFLSTHFPELLKNLYVYLEFNLAPSALIKRNKQKKIDSLSLDLIEFISRKVSSSISSFSLEDELAGKYLHYFSKFLDASNMKKLKDIASRAGDAEKELQAEQSTVPIRFQKKQGHNSKNAVNVFEKQQLFSKVLSISSNFLKLNSDNSPFYKYFISILPFANTEEFKKHSVACVTSLNLPFIDADLTSILNNMTVFDRSMKLTLNYDKFLDAVFKVAAVSS